MHEEAAIAIQDAAQVEKGAADVDVADVDVPVLVGTQGLHEAGSFLGGLLVVPVQTPGFLEDAPDGLGAAGDEVLVEHAESQATIAVERMGVVIVHDGTFLLGQEPVVARNAGAVFIDLAVALLPVEELGTMDVQPGDEALLGQLGFFGPEGDEVDDLVAHVMRNPAVR